jgi:hypothetical protein
MGRLLAWIAGALGVAGLAKALRKRQETVPETGPDPRAEELRRRLDEAKPLAEDVPEADETPADDPPPARTREDVHAQARAAIDEMRRSGSDDGGDAGGEPARDA